MLAYNQKYDPWPIHVDNESAKKSPFGGIIASGGYTISLMYQASHMIYNNDTRQ
jgi:acyl dehydratase